ncbi:MAG: hydroxymethylbilane synthase [Planctomycetota bacterium]
MTIRVRIATRGSALALYQARQVAAALQAAGTQAGESVETVLCRIKTTGDMQRAEPLHVMEAAGKGLFTREIDRALCDGEADVAVHSMKDLPAERPAETELVAVLPRATPWDAIAFREPSWTVATLPRGAKVAVGSERRRLQLLRLRPDLAFQELRGNIPTRIKKLSAGADAVVLAAAALERLEINPVGLQVFTREQMLPAVGQGIIAIECRAGFEQRALVEAIRDPATWTVARAERAFLTAFGGGCHVPVGGLAWQANGQGAPAELRMVAAHFSLTGGLNGTVEVDEVSGLGATGHAPEELGRELAQRLKSLLAAAVR